MPVPAWMIRTWNPGDRISNASLSLAGLSVGPAFEMHGAPRDEPGRQSMTLVAVRREDQSAIVGAGTLFESPVAPARWRLALHVNPVYRRQGIGTALLATLAAEAATHDDRALQVGLSYAATDSVDFFVRRGFRYLMRTRLGTLDPTHISDSTWIRISDSERWADRLALRIRSLANVEDRVAHTPAIADLHTRIYQQTHAWSPLAPLDAETAIALFLGDDLLPDALFVAFDSNRPVGVSSLRYGESATAFDLGWTGVLAEYGPHVPDLTLALLGHTLSFARAAKRSITFEVDASDGILWNLIGSLPVSSKPDWFNLERANSPSPKQPDPSKLASIAPLSS